MAMIGDKELALTRLRERIQQDVPIPDSEWDFAVTLFRIETFSRNSFLAKAGDKLDNVFSITCGLVRYYYITDSGREFNKYFVMDNRLFGSFSSLFLGMPCGFFMQALEDTGALVITRKSMDELYSRHSCWERLGRMTAMSFICHMEKREKEFLLDSLETRYCRFIDEYPGLINRVHQYHVASYLGVTDVALSRLRKKISHTGNNNLFPGKIR